MVSAFITASETLFLGLQGLPQPTACPSNCHLRFLHASFVSVNAPPRSFRSSIQSDGAWDLLCHGKHVTSPDPTPSDVWTAYLSTYKAPGSTVKIQKERHRNAKWLPSERRPLAPEGFTPITPSLLHPLHTLIQALGCSQKT